MGDHHSPLRRHARRASVGLALATASLLLGACASSNSPPANASGVLASIAPAGSAAQPSASPSPPPINYLHQWAITSQGSDGSTWTTTFATGDLLSGTAMQVAIPAGQLAACQVDPQRDAVIPWRAVTTSDTHSFTITTHNGFYLVGPDTSATGQDTGPPAWLGPDESVSVAADYGSGTDCQSLTATGTEEYDPNAWFIYKPLNQGAQTTLTGVLVLQGWRSPAHPDGDTRFANSLWLAEPQQENNDPNRWTTTSVTGPAVVGPSVGGDSLGGWFFPLSGRGHLDCQGQVGSNPAWRAVCGQ